METYGKLNQLELSAREKEETREDKRRRKRDTRMCKDISILRARIVRYST